VPTLNGFFLLLPFPFPSVWLKGSPPRFAQQSWCMENVLFYHAVQEYREETEENRHQLGQDIYSKYVANSMFPLYFSRHIFFSCAATPTSSLPSHPLTFLSPKGSECQVNLPMDIREKITKDIKEENFSPFLFDQALNHTMEMLRQSIFPLWKKSPLFKESMKALNVKNMQELRVLKSSTQKPKDSTSSLLDLSAASLSVFGNTIKKK